jgi:hypothetical protein
VTFADWYDSTIVPQLNETLKNVPVQARETLRTASRQTMAACWNACVAAVWNMSQEVRTGKPQDESLPTFAMMEPYEYPLFEILRSVRADTDAAKKTREWLADWKVKHGVRRD